jgi:uncharacterized protein YqeY
METKVRALIKQAMIDKNTNAKTTYSSILETALKAAKADGNRAVTDDDFVEAAKKEVKQLNEYLEYVSNDAEKVAEINEKISYCEAILPKMATAEQILEYLTANNVERNIGVCMKTLKAAFGSTFNGKIASEVVSNYIA